MRPSHMVSAMLIQASFKKARWQGLTWGNGKGFGLGFEELHDVLRVDPTYLVESNEGHAWKEPLWTTDGLISISWLLCFAALGSHGGPCPELLASMPSMQKSRKTEV